MSKNINKIIMLNGKTLTEQDILNKWNKSTELNYIKRFIDFKDYLHFMYSNYGVDPAERKIAINPIAEFRDSGANILKQKLEALELDDILFIVREHSYDPFKQLTKGQKKSKEYLINFLVTRASKLSKLGTVFRYTSNDHQ